MAKYVTVATFNAENLFTRYNFRGKKTGRRDAKGKVIYKPFTKTQLQKAVSGEFIIDKNVFNSTMTPTRKLTTQAIRGVKANIMGLQEIENLDTLKRFNSRFLKSTKFKFPVVIDGNDPRFIDVGILSNLPVDFVRTHQFRKKGRSKVFSRDCLEAHFDIGGNPLVVFVNHFKSMMGGRSATKKRRADQSAEMIKILKETFGTNYGNHDFVILGDLNDYMEAGEESSSGIRALLQSNQMENVIDRLPADQRWTHYYKGNKSYNQLDYILISKSLAKKNKTVKPYIERRGQPTRVNQRGKPPRVKKFFKGVSGTAKASDHCPVSIKLKV